MPSSYLPDVESVKNYYADALIMQYRSKKKARETVKTGAQIYLGDTVLLQLQDILDIDKAVGKQLDIIGKILDCPRIIQGINPEVRFFSFEKTNARGFSTKDRLNDGPWKTAENSLWSIYSLPDSSYRILLKFKAIKNRLRASMAEIDDLLYSIFGNDIYMVNNLDLSITYYISDNILIPAQAAVALGYLEAPVGVSVNYVYQ